MINAIVLTGAAILLFCASRLVFQKGKIKIFCPACNNSIGFSRLNVLRTPIICPECAVKLITEKKSYLLIVMGFSIACLLPLCGLLVGSGSKPNNILNSVFDVLYIVSWIVVLVGWGKLRFIPYCER